jgi:transcriptional repressor NrdR
MAGLTRACVKRPVPLAQIEQAAVRIEADLRNGVGDEVEARRIGEQALRVLRDLDRVAYVRFASVYRDFQDVDEFERELALLEGRKKPAKRVAKRTSVR